MEQRRVILRDLLSKRPADVAAVLTEISEDQAIDLVHRLFLRQQAAEPLAEMEPEDSAEILARLDRDEAIKILSRMDPDDAVDLLEELPPETQQELLSRLADEDAEVLSNLLAYPPDSAGGLMSPEFVELTLEMTTGQAIDLLRRRVEEAETVYYAYITDSNGHLVGVVGLRDMALAPPDTQLARILKRDIVSVLVTEDVEDVARLFDKYNFVALPVIDASGELLGIITVDDVIDVIRDEATEDIYGLAAVPREEGVDTSWRSSFRMRLPWMYVRLATGLAAAVVVGLFEDMVAKVAALAVLMGVVAGQGGSAGMQTVTIMTRGIALGDVDHAKGLRLLGKEALLGMINGLLIGLTVGLITLVWKGDLLLGVAMFGAMTLTLAVAGAAGALIPLLVRALGKDPALASGIFLTTITDVLGYAVLFILAWLLLPELG